MDPESQHKIHEIIFYFIHVVPRLKYLFQRWCRLNREERYFLDEEVRKILNVKGKLIYTPLRDAFIKWNNVQDTQGAPGFQPGSNEYRCNGEIEEEITKVIYALEMTFDNLYRKTDIDLMKDRISKIAQKKPARRSQSRSKKKFKIERSKSVADSSRISLLNNKKNAKSILLRKCASDLNISDYDTE